jgi:hypothetical protein
MDLKVSATIHSMRLVTAILVNYLKHNIYQDQYNSNIVQNYRHLALLSDLMTNKGQLIAINKFRVNEENFQLIITDLLLKKLLIFNRNSCIFSTRLIKKSK